MFQPSVTGYLDPTNTAYLKVNSRATDRPIFVLDTFDDAIYSRTMKSYQDIYKLMQKRLLNECRRIRAIRREMDELASPHLRYMDLEEDLAKRLHSTSSLLGLFGSDGVAETKKLVETINSDDLACLEETLKERRSPQELREELRIWRAVREYVRMAGESSVVDIQEFLEWIGVKNVTRQAIESALRQHKENFEITRRGHERYVALK
jgi:hypothetical protein